MDGQSGCSRPRPTASARAAVLIDPAVSVVGVDLSARPDDKARPRCHHGFEGLTQHCQRFGLASPDPGRQTDKQVAGGDANSDNADIDAPRTAPFERRLR